MVTIQERTVEGGSWREGEERREGREGKREGKREGEEGIK